MQDDKSKNVSFKENDEIREFDAEESSEELKKSEIKTQKTNFAEKVRPTKTQNQQNNNYGKLQSIFWNPNSSPSENSNTENSRKNFRRQDAKPITWEIEKEPLSRETIEKLRHIGRQIGQFHR